MNDTCDHGGEIGAGCPFCAKAPPASSLCTQAMSPEETAIRSDEFARIRSLVQAKVRRLHDLGRARDADRWRAVDAWLRGQAPRL